MRRTTNYVTLAAVILSVGTGALAYGQPTNCYGNRPGCLDSTFGNGTGHVALPSLTGWIEDMAIQSVPTQAGAERRIVVVGAGYDWTLARFSENGALDTTFGADRTGIVKKSPRKGNPDVYGVVVQPDQRLVVAGLVPTGKWATCTFAVARYDQDGIDDTSFGSGGTVAIPLYPPGGWARDVALQSDGKIVAAGGSGSTFGEVRISVVRLEPDGTLDTDFGWPRKDGKFLYGDGLFDGSAMSVAMDPVQDSEGKWKDRVVISGFVRPDGQGYRSAFVMRLTPEGELDTSFAGSGVTTFDIPTPYFNETIFYDVAVDPVHRIVAVGYYYDDSTGLSQPLMARYNENGDLDTAFRDDRVVRQNWLNSDHMLAVAIQPDGKILTTGRSETAYGDNYLAVWRFLDNGQPDADFGQGGWTTTSFPDTQEWFKSGKAVVLQSDGTFVVGGYAIVPGSSKRSTTVQVFALARYFW